MCRWSLLILLGAATAAGCREGDPGGFKPCNIYRCESVSTQLTSHLPRRIAKKLPRKEFRSEEFNGRKSVDKASWTVYLGLHSLPTTAYRRRQRLKNSLLKKERSLRHGSVQRRTSQQSSNPRKRYSQYFSYFTPRRDTISRREEVIYRNLLRNNVGGKHADLRGKRVKRWSGSPARTVLKLDFARKKRKNGGCHKYAVFKVFGTDFMLCLLLGSFLEDPILMSSRDLRVSIYGNGTSHRTRRLSSMYLQLAEGHLIGQELSSVRGYVWRDKFYGSVRTEKFILQIEPLTKSGPVITQFSSMSNRMLNAYVYRVFLKSNTRKKKKKVSVFGNTLNIENQVYKSRFPTQTLKSGRFDWSRVKRDMDRGNSSCRSCGLLLISDHTFFKEVGEGSVKQTVLQMLYHVREANILFRNLNLEGQDCLGLHVSGIGVITSPDYAENLLRGDFKSPEEYLRTFSRYQLDGYCLATLFSSRILGNHVLGLSWQGDPKRKAGVCQIRGKIKATKELYNLNSLFITLRTRKTERIPLRMGVLNLAHEILHSFGARHDTDLCSPKQEHSAEGRYLMSRYSGTGLHSNNDKISSCTSQAVSKSLSNPEQTYCLHQIHSEYCGNGVVDAGEECDCGNVASCLERRSCCSPPGLRRGEDQCMWRRSMAACANKTRLFESDYTGSSFHRLTQSRPRSSRRHRRGRIYHRRRRRPRKQNRLCKILGFQPCRCSGSCLCCKDRNSSCTEIYQIIFSFFRAVQKTVRGCEDTVLNCLYQSEHPYYPLVPQPAGRPSLQVLRELSALKPDKKGTVVCLQTRVDSNCWQLNLQCSRPSKQKP